MSSGPGHIELARSLDSIHIGRRHDAGALLVGDAEAVGEIECLAGCQVLLHRRPERDLCRVGEQVLNHGSLLAGLLDLEERLARHPAVGHRLVPRFAVLPLPHDHIEAVVTQVERLPGALHTITDHGDRLILHHLLSLAQRKLVAGHYVLFNPAKIHFCHIVI